MQIGLLFVLVIYFDSWVNLHFDQENLHFDQEILILTDTVTVMHRKSA